MYPNGTVHRENQMTIRSALAGATVALGVLVAAGCASADPTGGPVTEAAPNESDPTSVEPTEIDRDAGVKDLTCNQTESKYHEKGYVYLYRYENCKGSHDARDKSTGDSDYGDGKGQIKDFDNKADSIVNTTTSHVEFYNYPNYNKDAGEKGDSFCLGPGEWITRLQYYGDADGTNDWWKNSISSHRKVKEEDCDRWFGWGSDR